MQNIIENLAVVHQQIKLDAQNAGRKESDVTLLCVSKTKSEDMIKAAYQAGERHFGESYALEAQGKITSLKAQGFNDIIWHFIGPIQSNKTKHIASHFDVVESVDRIKILDRLNEQRPDGLPVLKIMIQVNISQEEQKQGCEEQELEALLEHAARLPKLKVIGLMGVARIDAPDEELNASFARLKALKDQYAKHYPELTELSMGMTADMAQAICQGSTEVRIGSAIFGARDYSKSKA